MKFRRLLDEASLLDASTAQGIRAFVIVTLVSNGAYLLFVLAYARLAGVI